MASTANAIKTGVSIADSILSFIFGYIERVCTVNIPKQFKWMKNKYFVKAKNLVNHPFLRSCVHPNAQPLVRGSVIGLAVMLGIVLAIILWFWVLARSVVK